MSTPPVQPDAAPAAGSEPAPLPHLGEEFAGKRNLPPAKIVGIVLGAFLVVLIIAAVVFRAKSPATGSIDEVESVEVPDQNMVMVLINVSIQNGPKTTFKMHSVYAELETNDGTQRDDPASSVDFSRYLDGFPTLKPHALVPLKIETIEPSGRRTGTILVTFPVTADAFAKKKSLKVVVSAYGEVADLVMTK